MGVVKVIVNGTTKMDITPTTATASDVASSKIFFNREGIQTTGTSSGGGGGSVLPKQVNFIDYDGSILYAYTAQEADALSALPANPSHSGLTAQGWNWTLAEIKAQLTALPNGDIWVGQIYITQSGNTEIDCIFPADSLHPYMGLGVKGTVTINWGDGATSTLTGTATGTIQWTDHVYASAGSYTVSISATDQFEFQNASSQDCGIFSNTNTTTNSREYSQCIKAIRIGTGYSSSNFSYRIRKCINLETFTIPSYITNIGENAFAECYRLKSITIPSRVTSIGNSAFSTCYNLKNVSLPGGVTTIGNSVFGSCYTLQSITIPSSTTSVGSSAFVNCNTLKSVFIPPALTTIATGLFSNCYSLNKVILPNSLTSIGNSAFKYCYALTSITVPSGVTTIEASTFSSDYSVNEYHFLATTPPTLANTNAFSSIQSYCVIYVPTASLNAYKTANNWSTYASYIQGE